MPEEVAESSKSQTPKAVAGREYRQWVKDQKAAGVEHPHRRRVSKWEKQTIAESRQELEQSQKPNLVLYRPQGNVPLEERKTAAMELMTCGSKETVIKGGARTGKSLAMLHRANAILCNFAGTRALLVRKTRTSLTEAALVTYETQVIPRNLAVYPDCQAQQRKIRQVYEYPNGSVMVVAGMDTPERILSTEYDLILVQQAEELNEHDWELLLTRLSHGKIVVKQSDGKLKTFHQIIGDMNPIYPSHWLNKRISDGRAKLLYSRHEDNPRWWDGKDWTDEGRDYLDTLKRLGGVRYLRFYKGIDAAAEGIVYPDFNWGTHTVEPFEIPAHWRRIRSIDFGFRHAFVCQWWAIDPDGVMYRYREIFYSERTPVEHAAQIMKISGSEKYEVTISDHTASDRATLHGAGVKTTPAIKHEMLRPGIDAVRERLKDNRLFLFRDGEVNGQKYGRLERDLKLAEQGRPTSTIEEFDSYSYPESKPGQVGKEDPVKEFDDGCDAMRYAVSHIDDVARRRFKLRGGRVGKATAYPLARAG